MACLGEDCPLRSAVCKIHPIPICPAALIFRTEPGLRVKDLDFDNGYVMVRQGKGNKDRRVPLARRLVEPLRGHLAEIRVMHGEDRAADLDGVHMPGAYGRKWPGAGKEWTWF